MNPEFFKLVEEQNSDINLKQKWNQKSTNFFDNFCYLNTDILIEDQILKLTHVGINSITQSGDLIQKMTNENLSFMHDELHSIINDMSALNTKFEILEKSIKSKTGLFSNKNSNEKFFNTFKEEENIIRQQINELNFKGKSLQEIKSNLDNNLKQLIDCYILLERDLKLLKEADSKLGNHDKESIKKIYNDNLFELTEIKSELLIHQQLIFQKYAGIQILLSNVLNCHKNINYISRVTYSAIMNVVEFQQIITLGQKNLDENQKISFQKVKEGLITVTQNLKAITSNPFTFHNY